MGTPKDKFSAAERAAVFTLPGEKCYLCATPLDLKTMQVDHVIPESLLADAKRLSAAIVSLGRPKDFDVNSFENWLPESPRDSWRPVGLSQASTVVT